VTARASTTELFPSPLELETRGGRERILADVRELLRTVDCDGPPYFDDGWIVLPAPPITVFKALQRIDPGWIRLFELFPGDPALRARARRLTAEVTRRRIGARRRARAQCVNEQVNGVDR
jgi:hypothetical protein